MGTYRIDTANKDTGATGVIYADASNADQARELAYSLGLLVSTVTQTKRPKHADASLVYAIQRGVWRAFWRIFLVTLAIQIAVFLVVWRILVAEGVI